jgi:hypothetical protein
VLYNELVELPRPDHWIWKVWELARKPGSKANVHHNRPDPGDGQCKEYLTLGLGKTIAFLDNE